MKKQESKTIVPQATENVNTKSEIVYIPVDKILPHPDNPRKDLGDLTELADSIRENGIRQNLVVVRGAKTAAGGHRSDVYMAIIGHRRLAAAKLAGLKEVNCVVAEMNDKDQLAAMLEENMQRSDLKFHEQVAGFQQLTLLGVTKEEIAKKTGFSTSTIGKRLKFADLDPEKLKKADERGANLFHFEELLKIKDSAKRSEVLEKVGTSNFNWELNNAINAERKEANKAVILETLRSFAEEVKSQPENSRYLQYIGLETDGFQKPKDADEQKYYFSDNKTYLQLYVAKPDDEIEEIREKQETETAQRQAAEQRKAQLAEISGRATELRLEFIKNFKPGKAHNSVLMQFAVRTFCNDVYCDSEFYLEIFSADEWDSLSVERKLAVCIFAALENDESYYNKWRLEYEDNNDLDLLYEFLCAVGYEMSDEERELKEGTHELYTDNQGNVPCEPVVEVAETAIIVDEGSEDEDDWDEDDNEETC